MPHGEETEPEPPPTAFAAASVPVSIAHAEEANPEPLPFAAVPASPEAPAPSVAEPALEPGPLATEPSADAATQQAALPAHVAPPPTSRRERRQAARAAAQLAKRNRRRAKELAKEERKSSTPQTPARRRPQDRRIAGRGCICRQQGRAAHRPLRARGIAVGRRRRRRVARAGAARGGPEDVVPQEQAAADVRPARDRKQPHRRPDDRDLRDRRRAPTRERGSLPCAGGAADPARRGSARLPDPRRLRRRARRPDVPRAARRRPPRARRALRQRMPQGRAEARSGSTSRHLAFCARSPTPPARTPPDAAVVCVAIGHDRSTLAVSDGRFCEFTRVLAVGRIRPRRRARAHARPHAGRSRAAEARAGRSERRAKQPGSTPDRRKRPAQRWRRSFAPSPASSSASLRFYQEQAEFPRDRRDHDQRRGVRGRRACSRARAADRNPRTGGRPAGTRARSPQAARARTARRARSQSPSALRSRTSRMRAVNLLPREPKLGSKRLSVVAQLALVRALRRRRAARRRIPARELEGERAARRRSPPLQRRARRAAAADASSRRRISQLAAPARPAGRRSGHCAPEPPRVGSDPARDLCGPSRRRLADEPFRETALVRAAGARRPTTAIDDDDDHLGLRRRRPVLRADGRAAELRRLHVLAGGRRPAARAGSPSSPRCRTSSSSRARGPPSPAASSSRSRSRPTCASGEIG